MSSIINRPEELVQQAIDGMLLASPHLARLDGYPDIKVVVNKHADKSKVALISGGGSGHEPAHAGYVGKGMLTAAVAGEVFASPSAEAVLAAIRAVTGPAGCLLIVKNYTGDRLHFGLAAEQAKAEGYKVDMVVVGEDVAIETPGLAGRRGLAGTVLVHKVAGAKAASGASLSDVTAAAQAAADAVATLGVALRVCALPGKPRSDRLKEGELEIGLGIHGEPGYEKAEAMSASKLVQRMLTQLCGSSFLQLQAGERVVLMVNNLGASTPLEMACVAREAVSYLQEHAKVSVERCFTGPFMTSLDMSGFSITLMRLQPGTQGDAILAALDAPVGAAGWPAVPAVVAPVTTLPVPTGPAGSLDSAAHASRPATLTAYGTTLERVIHSAALALVDQAEHLNSLDAKVGDGDCGDTVAHGARAILTDLPTKYPRNDPAGTVACLAASVRQAVGGTSGALYDVALTAAARCLKEVGVSEPGPAEWARALQAGTQAVAKYGGARAGSRTMLDALLPATLALEEAVAEGLSATAAAARASDAANGGAQATADMAATAGRASYVPLEVLKSTPDPGAVAVSVWLGAVTKALQA